MHRQLRILFEGFIGEQHRKLSEMVDRAVNALTMPEQLTSALRDLGQRHLAYGVKAHHHTAVADSMLVPLEQMLGDDFTMEMKGAWTSFYAFLQKGMEQ